MLSFLLDEHISPHVPVAAKRFDPRIRIVPLHSWRAGEFWGAKDEAIIPASITDGLTFVTYDQKPSAHCSDGGSKKGGKTVASSLWTRGVSHLRISVAWLDRLLLSGRRGTAGNGEIA